MKVSFVDLKLQHKSIKKDLLKAAEKIIDTSSFILGPDLEKFESNFAKFCESKFCVGTSSGSAALFIALKVLGLKPGDEVITVPNTFIATTQAITLCGGKIKFVDVDKEAYLMDTDKLEETITPKTKMILPVHLYGQMCDMKPIIEIAKKHNLKILEDSCQAHGAEYLGKRSPLVDVAVYSFYPSKNIGAFGDAGAVVTSREDIYEKAYAIRDYGRRKGDKHLHKEEGFNLRMDSLQAAILNVKLKYIEEWTERRRKNAELYNKLLREIVTTPVEKENRKHVYYVYVIQSEKRDDLRKFLFSKGVETGIHFPVPLYSQPVYNDLRFDKKDFPNTEVCSKRILSLPMFPELKKEQIIYVCDQIKNFYSKI